MTRRALTALALAAGACTTADVPAPPPEPVTAPPSPPTDPLPAPTVAVPQPAVTRPPAVTVTAASPPRSPARPVEAGAVEPSDVAGAQTARASWYGSESGSRTADGTAFDGSQMVFAHRTMRFGTMVRFCHAGACVVARCADRGPAAWTGKTFDLSRAAFGAIAPLGAGVVTVTWEAA